jgi:competence ComEA-like helix-hairpin-helix protein
MWKHFVKEYFALTHKERLGAIIIAFIIFFSVCISFAFPLFSNQKKYSHKDFENEIARIKTQGDDGSKNNKYSKNFNDESNDNDYYSSSYAKEYSTKAEVFYFDPNTASSGDWKRLGLRDKTIHTIQNYLSKGGKFYKPEDISKIWGLSPADAQRLIPYVSIKNTVKEYSSFEKNEYHNTSVSYTPKTIQPFDINLADTTDLINLPGIGSKLSQRIIAFRNKLGGFYSVDQVAETYLLPDSVFQKIKPALVINNAHIKQININTATIDEMKSHPYLRYNLANAIFQYRQQHGNFNSVDEIKKIMIITENVFNKVAPYLTVQ